VKWGGKLWAGFIWLRVGTNGVLLRTELSGSIKGREYLDLTGRKW
jgi:hypothetical protein